MNPGPIPLSSQAYSIEAISRDSMFRSQFNVDEDIELDDDERPTPFAVHNDEVDPLSGLLYHRGIDAKAKTRQKLVDEDNEMEQLSRKICSIEVVKPTQMVYSEVLAGESKDIHLLLTGHRATLLGALNHQSEDYNLSAVKQIRRFMCLDDVVDRTDKILDLNILPRLRYFLTNGKAPIQYETCWILTNIAAGSSAQTNAVVDADTIDPLVRLLSSDTEQVRVQAAWTLGNFAGDCKELSQRLLDAGILNPLLILTAQPKYAYTKHMEALQVVCWLLANLCRWDTKDWMQVEWLD
ncbi:hypothetical protein HK101_003500 [Irineochytrium annulatum]|nr:hypothetical protein HK101_003500 [Irineochytrium annulatum]